MCIVEIKIKELDTMKPIENKSLLGGGNPLLKCAVKAVENDSAVIASHIKIRKMIMSFPARCCAFVRSGIFAPARVLKKHSSCRFLSFIRIIRRSLEFFASAKNRDDVWCFCKSHLFKEITTSEPVALPRDDGEKRLGMTLYSAVIAS